MKKGEINHSNCNYESNDQSPNNNLSRDSHHTLPSLIAFTIVSESNDVPAIASSKIEIRPTPFSPKTMASLRESSSIV